LKIYTLKMRHTGSPNIGGGEGAMVGEDVSYTLSTSQDQTIFQPDDAGYVVRRLTPMECERLQGFPDGWTNLTGSDPDAIAQKVGDALGYGDKERKALARKAAKWAADCPDTPRYKAMGNSMAVPVMRLIGRRVEAFDILHYDEVGLYRPGE
jgi:DNA (cytosine-5)-methyltransferase 1